MKRSDFTFDLPGELVAQKPLAERSASRLLCLDRQSGVVRDGLFRQIPALLNPGDLLVFNDTRVIPARLFGHKETSGKVEILVERLLDDQQCLAQVRASKTPLAGGILILENGERLEVLGREGEFFHLRAKGAAMSQIMEEVGHMPLPPYIQREDTESDRARYQTVYASRPGAVAAPTAGLHFDRDLLDAIKARGVQSARVTLHVGAGTFQPVRAERLEDHQMHAEFLEVPEQTCHAVEAARKRGGRVVAVGTTAVRSLETAAMDGRLQAFRGDSRIFLYPGYRFRVVDALITNFHLPESTLLMLVCAMAGVPETLAAYRHAVEKRYRFFSYGDAMLVS
jgi:S-adenosylmethionine:tRNA ribosyltransferase-isomerase